MAGNRKRFTIGAIATAAALSLGAGAAHGDEPEPYEVLVVGKTSGFRHSNIDETTNAIIALGEANGFSVDVWDPAQPELSLESTPFTSGADLTRYATVVFVSTVDGTNRGNPFNRPLILDDDERAAYEDYIESGGGFVGIHGATDSMHTSEWYGGLIGGSAYFRNHPAQQQATVVVEDPTHPSTDFLPSTWVLFDEWYNYTNNPREVVRVLMTLDESSYNPGFGAMGEDHPITWCHNYDGGRSWQTGIGHREDVVADPAWQQMVLGGIEWTAGIVSGGGDCVTYDEVATLFESALANVVPARAAQAERMIAPMLEASEAAAATGDHAAAAHDLALARVLAGSMLGDRELAGKIGDLIEWQSGLG